MAPLANKSSNNCSTMIPQKAGRRQRRIEFVPYVNVVDIPNRSDFSEEEVQAVWYNCGEMQHFKKRVRTAIGRLSANGEGSSCHGEGLETKDESMERRTRVHEARFAIFFEQEYQWEDNVEDPEYIADLYFDYTSYSQCLAQERAAALAKHVQEINRPAPQKTYVTTSDVCFSNNLLSPMKRRSAFPTQSFGIKSPFSTQGKSHVDLIDMALSIVQ
jgi:hypothetical protein